MFCYAALFKLFYAWPNYEPDVLFKEIFDGESFSQETWWNSNLGKSVLKKEIKVDYELRKNTILVQRINLRCNQARR